LAIVGEAGDISATAFGTSEQINLILIEELEVASDAPFAAPVIIH
jgi:hypothetical protein